MIEDNPRSVDFKLAVIYLNQLLQAEKVKEWHEQRLIKQKGKLSAEEKLAMFEFEGKMRGEQ